MEFFLQQEIQRTAGDFHAKRRAWQDAEVRMGTTTLIDEHVYKLYRDLKYDRGGPRSRSGVQLESDLNAAEKLWHQTRAANEAAVDAEYDAGYAYRDVQRTHQELEDRLEAILQGEEIWDRIYGDGGRPYSSTARTFNDYKGNSYHFKKVWPPPSRDNSPRRPSPTPRRATSPPPRCDRPQSSPQFKKPTPFQRSRLDHSRVDNWFDEVDTALANPSTVRSFPQPPRWTCARQQAGTECAKVALGLCACCMESMFEGLDLKAARKKFHPDKYSRAPENVREAVQKDASEVFKWVDGRFQELEDMKEAQAKEREKGWGRNFWGR